MTGLILSVKTDTEWINNIADTPVLGHMFLLILMLVPAALLSFFIHSIIPELNNDVGFTKAMLVLLPSWNAFLWFSRTKLYFFFLPSWILLGGIALVKAILLIASIDDGQ